MARAVQKEGWCRASFRWLGGSPKGMLLLLALLSPAWAADQCSFVPQLGCDAPGGVRVRELPLAECTTTTTTRTTTSSRTTSDDQLHIRDIDLYNECVQQPDDKHLDLFHDIKQLCNQKL
eukprot:s1595_g6.t1